MTLTPAQKFKMKNTKDLPNMKELNGIVDVPLAMEATTYTNGSEEHNVLAILFRDSGIYRTECKGFIDSFMAYWEAFAEEPDEQKPPITISIYKSKKGNDTLKMTVDA